MRPVLERGPSGFTVRVEHPSGGTYVMTDGGKHASLENFLPEAISWLSKIGCPDDASHLTITSLTLPREDLR
jgi:hypothetical protein